AWSRVFFDSRGKTMLWNVRDKAGVFLPMKADHILGFSPDGKWLAAHEPSGAAGIQLWDVASKQLSRTISLDWPNHLSGAAESPVRSVRFSPDSQKLAVNVHGQIRLATIESGRLHTALERTGHAGRVRAIDVSPDGRLLATASDDQTVGLWNAADGDYAAMLDGFQTAPGNVAFFPDSQRLATVDLEGRLFVWRLNARSADDRLPLEANLLWKAPVDAKTSNGGTKALAVSADGALLAAQTTANAVTIYRAENGEVAHLVRVETPMNSLAFATDGRWLAGGGNDGVVRLWDPATGKSLAAWHSGQGVVNVVAAQTAGDLLVTAGRDIRLWQPVSRQLLLVLGEQRRPVNDLAFSRDGRLLATASDDQSLVWRFGDLGDELKRMGLGWTGLEAISPQPTNVPSEAVGEADSAIAADAPATDTSDGEATPNDGPPTIDALRPTMDLGGHAAPVTCLSFDSDGRRLVSGDQQGTVVVWDAANRSAGLVTSRHDKSVWAVAFASGDQRIATASDDATIRICDATNGLNETIIQTPCGIHALAYQPGGKLLAAAGADGTAYLFDAATGEKTAALAASEKALWSVAFSPDGKRLATAGVDPVIKIWDVGNSAAVSSLQGHTAVVWSVAFHPDGNRLASASDDWSVRIWDVASAQELRKLTGHTISPYSVAFSRDGQFMASAAGHRWQPRHNGEVIVWDTASWQNHTYPGTACGFFAAAFRPNRPQLAAAGTDRSIHVWDLPAAWAAEDTPAGIGAEVLAGGSSAAWSPDGTQVFYSAGGDDGIHRIDLPTRSVAQLIAPGHDPAVSPLGKQLAYARNTDARQEEVWLAEVDGSNRRKLADGGFPKWAADGQTLYFHSRSDGKVKAIDVTAADSTARDVVECRESFYPAVSPDGKRLAYVAGGNLTVVHLGTNDRLVRSLPGAGSGLVGWSPDGKQLAYGGYGVNDRVGLWLLDVGTGNAKQLFAGQYTMPAWSPDGKRLAFDLRTTNRSLILAIETEKLKPPE
ncbi:MAG TPA: hypothetical protein VJ783_26365, partial [Pirellulales bacterium]|nr:hypothetical protein [Pirellulales bacterium]